MQISEVIVASQKDLNVSKAFLKRLKELQKASECSEDSEEETELIDTDHYFIGH